MRIIGGHWRGSRLPVVDIEGLRPSGDRARETLFNWLAPVLPGKRVLDLFAGSGALGLEAASRGAKLVRLVEFNRRAAASLRDTAEKLNGAETHSELVVVAGDALVELDRPVDMAFDVVLIDPPFAAGMYDVIFERLGAWLAPAAMIYVESPSDHAAPPVPAAWQGLKQKVVGSVRMQLFRVNGEVDSIAKNG